MGRNGVVTPLTVLFLRFFTAFFGPMQALYARLALDYKHVFYEQVVFILNTRRVSRDPFWTELRAAGAACLLQWWIFNEIDFNVGYLRWF